MNKVVVLYINHTSGLGGAALSLYNLINSLGNNVLPIVLIPSKGQAYEFFSRKGIRCIIHPFRCNIREKNVLTHYLRFIPHYIRDKYFNNVCCRYVIKELGSLKVNIVHSNSSVFTIGIDLAKRLSAKHVWHIREFQDLDFGMKPFLGWNNLKRKIYASDAVIAITKAVYEYWDLDKAHNACYLWDAVRSGKDIIYKEKKQKYFFFCAAMLSDVKGAAFAIEAFGRSNLTKDGYKLVLAGNITENYKNTLEGIMKTYDITENVELIGYCNNIKPYMAEATAFLMCSRNEGLGRVTVEAMFYGCPVIARNTGGTLEFIKNKENGLIFSEVASCAQAMKYVAYNSCEDMILSAQQFAVENFSEEKYGQVIINIYRGILN